MKNLMKAAMVMAMAAMVFTVSGQPRQGEGQRQRPEQGERQRMTPEQMIDRQVEQMVKDYQLDDKQKGEVKALFEKQQKERQANRPKEGEKPNMEDRKAQFEKAQKDFDAELKKIMTADQYKKYEEKQAERKKQMEERMKNRPQRQRPDMGQ